MEPKERWHLIFTGQVQSVGFRYRSQYAANALGLSGWVQNLWDGSVEMEVQGTPSEIEQMISAVCGSEYIHIDQVTKDVITLQEDCGFHIR